MIDATTIARFRSLFDGLQRHYGTYDITGVDPDERGKLKGKAATICQPVTDELVRQHLAGEQSLGMVPVRDDATTRFGAIDIDIYGDLDVSSIAGILVQRGLPLIPCRTKSAGLHLYVFTSEPVPAAAMRRKLTEIKAMLGHGGAEVFPKQDRLGTDEKGSWINLPFFGDTRPAIRTDGEALTLEQFLELAERMRVDKSFFGKSTREIPLPGGPPCLNHLVQIGIEGHGSNTTLFNLGIYSKRAHAGTWKTELENYNRGVLTPPLGFAEVGAIIKSLDKKDDGNGYGYQCSASPLVDHCDKALCRTRRFGVGSSGEVFPVLGPLIKYGSTPPTYRFEVDGVLISLNADQLFTYWQFKRECQMALNRVMPSIKQKEWDTLLAKSLEQMDIQPMDDVSPESQFWELLRRFCTRNPCNSLDEIMLGRPYTDGGKTSFRLADLLAFLAMHRFQDVSMQKAGAIMRQRGALSEFKKIRGVGVNFWVVPEFDAEIGSYAVPDFDGMGPAF